MSEELRVTIVSSWDERCGNAVYAENLAKSLTPYPVKVIVVPASASPYGFEGLGMDVAIFNYASGMTMNPLWVDAFPRFSVKKVLIKQETTIDRNRSSFTDAFNAVVVHHKEVVHEASNFHYIPHGILEVEDLAPPPVGLVVGTAGIPHPWKGHVGICKAVALIPEAKAFFLMPESRHGDAKGIAAACREVLPPERLTIVHDWLPNTEVVRVLARETSVCAFGDTSWYWAAGVSGCVRLATAAHRPVVVPDIWHFRDIKEHAYVCDTRNSSELAETLKRAYSWAVTTQLDTWTPLLQEMGWSVVGREFYELLLRVAEKKGVTV